MELKVLALASICFTFLYYVQCEDENIFPEEEILADVIETDTPVSDEGDVKWSRANRRWMKKETRFQRGNKWLKSRKEARRRAYQNTHDDVLQVPALVSKEYNKFVPCHTCMVPIMKHIDNMNGVIREIMMENNILKGQVNEVKQKLVMVLSSAEKMETEFQSWRSSLRFPGLSPIDSASVSNIKDSVNRDERIFEDCYDVLQHRRTRPGVYSLQPVGSAYQINAYCNDGWTLIQRRYDESEDFFRHHRDYKVGFGTLGGEFWLGLENMHEMTKLTNYTLRVDVTDFHDKLYYAVYDGFYIDSEINEYALRIGRLLIASEDKDGLSDHDRVGFSTRDRDNDKWRHGHCARHYKTGWWSTNCGSDLNRRYMRWSNLVVKTSLMRIKPRRDMEDNDLLPAM